MKQIVTALAIALLASPAGAGRHPSVHFRTCLGEQN
jgi:hypothetical protein